MQFFTERVNDIDQLAIFTKCSISDAAQGSKYTSAIEKEHLLIVDCEKAYLELPACIL